MPTKRVTREAPRQRTHVPSVLSIISEYFKEVFGGAKKSKRKPSLHSRSFAPAAIHAYEAHIARLGWTHEKLVEDEEFFDEPVCTSRLVRPRVQAKPAVSRSTMPKVKADTAAANRGQPTDNKWSATGRRQRQKEARRQMKQQQGTQPDGDDSDDDTPLENFVEFFDNSDRKQHGLGLIRRLFGGVEVSKDWKPRRPYFTWWITIIQMVIFIAAISFYGIAPIGISSTAVEADVLTTSLTVQRVSYMEQDNMWIGPRQDDLIHMGARFSPCMRQDVNIERVLACDRGAEKDTACCVYNDGRGCLQVPETQCPRTLATWKKWTAASPGYQNRTSGAVCGQDPKYCTNPASSGAFVWQDDITEWPICTETANATNTQENSHMTCDIVGRPCCVGIQGECIIATREYCDFRRGYFHENENLCSQVKCFEEVCGMFPFGDPDKPDQFYRLFSSMFLHAGIFSLVVTVLFQLLIMRDLERIAGWWRIAITYIGGGVAGSLASAIFLPYHVEAGPSGSQFAVLASLIVEVFRWNKDKKPFVTVLKIVVMLIILFGVGLMPGIDNYAHLFGFFYGLFLSIAFRPYKSLCKKDVPKAGQWACAVVALILSVVVFVILIILFYVSPLYECANCSYFNCIPFTATFCDSMTVTISRTESSCLA